MSVDSGHIKVGSEQIIAVISLASSKSGFGTWKRLVCTSTIQRHAVINSFMVNTEH